MIAQARNDGVLNTALDEQDGVSSEWRVYDKLNGREMTLTAREIEAVRRIKAGTFANKETEM